MAGEPRPEGGRSAWAWPKRLRGAMSENSGMNTARQAVLTTRAMGKPTSTSGLLSKARALAALEDAGVPCAWDELPEKRRELIRGECVYVIRLAESLQTYEGSRASDVCVRLMGILDNEPEPDPGEWLPIYLDDTLTVEDRLAWLSIMFEWDVAHLVGFKVNQAEWRAGDSDRIKWVEGQSRPIFMAEDPLAAAAKWRENPPTPPAKLFSG